MYITYMDESQMNESTIVQNSLHIVSIFVKRSTIIMLDQNAVAQCTAPATRVHDRVYVCCEFGCGACQDKTQKMVSNCGDVAKSRAGCSL